VHLDVAAAAAALLLSDRRRWPQSLVRGSPDGKPATRRLLQRSIDTGLRDGRTPNRCVNPAPHTMQEVSKTYRQCDFFHQHHRAHSEGPMLIGTNKTEPQQRSMLDGSLTPVFTETIQYMDMRPDFQNFLSTS